MPKLTNNRRQEMLIGMVVQVLRAIIGPLVEKYEVVTTVPLVALLADVRPDVARRLRAMASGSRQSVDLTVGRWAGHTAFPAGRGMVHIAVLASDSIQPLQESKAGR